MTVEVCPVCAALVLHQADNVPRDAHLRWHARTSTLTGWRVKDAAAVMALGFASRYEAPDGGAGGGG